MCLIKTLFCNLDLFYGFAKKKFTKYAYFCLPLECPNPLTWSNFKFRRENMTEIKKIQVLSNG